MTLLACIMINLLVSAIMILLASDSECQITVLVSVMMTLLVSNLMTLLATAVMTLLVIAMIAMMLSSQDCKISTLS